MPMPTTIWASRSPLKAGSCKRQLTSRVLALSPDRADAHNNLGLTLAAQGKATEAAAHYERDHANAHNNPGLALAAQNGTTEAITHDRRALVLNPARADAHHNLGLALAER